MRIKNIQGKDMTKKIILTITLSGIIAITGCTKAQVVKYKVNKEKNIERVQRSFELYKEHKLHKSMAIAMDNQGKYIIGYSYDCKSTNSAKRIALDKCRKANNNTNVKVDATCVIYAAEDQIVHQLK